LWLKTKKNNSQKALLLNLLLLVPDVVNFECAILDPIIELQNLEITKQQKKTYELNKHFHGT
jgi:hypothetical protein